jgi:hypothetical protein
MIACPHRRMQIEGVGNSVLARTNRFGCKKGEVTRGWIKIHNDELRHVYYSPYSMTKSMRMNSIGHIARM